MVLLVPAGAHCAGPGVCGCRGLAGPTDLPVIEPLQVAVMQLVPTCLSTSALGVTGRDTHTLPHSQHCHGPPLPLPLATAEAWRLGGHGCPLLPPASKPPARVPVQAPSSSSHQPLGPASLCQPALTGQACGSVLTPAPGHTVAAAGCSAVSTASIVYAVQGTARSWPTKASGDPGRSWAGRGVIRPREGH